MSYLKLQIRSEEQAGEKIHLTYDVNLSSLTRNPHGIYDESCQLLRKLILLLLPNHEKSKLFAENQQIWRKEPQMIQVGINNVQIIKQSNLTPRRYQFDKNKQMNQTTKYLQIESQETKIMSKDWHKQYVRIQVELEKCKKQNRQIGLDLQQSIKEKYKKDNQKKDKTMSECQSFLLKKIDQELRVKQKKHQKHQQLKIFKNHLKTLQKNNEGWDKKNIEIQSQINELQEIQIIKLRRIIKELQENMQKKQNDNLFLKSELYALNCKAENWKKQNQDLRQRLEKCQKQKIILQSKNIVQKSCIKQFQRKQVPIQESKRFIKIESNKQVSQIISEAYSNKDQQNLPQNQPQQRNPQSQMDLNINIKNHPVLFIGSVAQQILSNTSILINPEYNLQKEHQPEQQIIQQDRSNQEQSVEKSQMSLFQSFNREYLQPDEDTEYSKDFQFKSNDQNS